MPDRVEGDQLSVPRHSLRHRRRRGFVLGLAAAVLAAGALAVYLGTGGSGGAHAPRPKAQARPTTTDPTVPPPAPVWRIAWGSAMAWGYGTAANATLRELSTLEISGSAVRVRISNLFGNQPLVVGDATAGVDAGGATLTPGTIHQLTFGGSTGTTIPIGGYVYSDPVPMAASAGQVIATSVYVSNADLMTVHPCCTSTVSYFTANGAGDLTSDPAQTAFIGSPWPRLVDAVDVLQSSGNGSIVVIGDSITDGYHSTARWTDVLQQRIDLLPPADRRAVINEGITANALTAVVPSDAGDGGGPPGVTRLTRDALGQSGVTEIVLFLGTNDLYFGAGSAQVIAGLQQAITIAHQAGVRIVGVTLLPREASIEEAWSPAQQAALQQVDNWILTSGAFDGVLNFATAVADVYDGACTPTSMFPPYDSGDHLHPNAAGETAMANSVDTTVLDLPAAPTVPPLVAVVPTPGCAGVLGIPSAAGPAPTVPSSTTTSTTTTSTTRARSTTT